MTSIFNRKTIYTFVSAAFIIVGTAVAIQYAKGNLRVTEQGFVQGTGLLAANSFPTGAEVHIDDKLVTATDDTIYLEPGLYNVAIIKEGYTPWNKQVRIAKELVTQTNAQLFPIAPSLSTLTFTGVTNLQPSPDGEKVIYYSASASAEKKNGLYILGLTPNNNLTLSKGPKQIAEDSRNFDLTTARYIWSPDSTEVMVFNENRTVLLDASKLNDLDLLPDIGYKQKQVLSEWEQEMYLRERQFLADFPEEIIQIATMSAENIYISPDKKRLIYTATETIALPENMVPDSLPSTNSIEEVRALEPNTIYIYDREEDRNYRIAEIASDSARATKKLLAFDAFDPNSPLITASPSSFTSLQATESAQTANNFNSYHSPVYANTFQWYPDSKHLLYVENNQIKIMEFDGGNQVTLYSGPFADHFVYPSPNGERLIIITSFSPDSPMNLYAVELK